MEFGQRRGAGLRAEGRRRRPQIPRTGHEHPLPCATSSSALPADGATARPQAGSHEHDAGMSAAAWSPVSLAVLCAGVGHGRPTRLLADLAAEAVCRALAAGGARAGVEVLDLPRLPPAPPHPPPRARPSLDLREA